MKRQLKMKLSDARMKRHIFMQKKPILEVFLVGASINKRARLLQSLVFFSFFYLRQTRSDER